MKDARFELLPPNLMLDTGEEGGSLIQEVNSRRFRGEVREIVPEVPGRVRVVKVTTGVVAGAGLMVIAWPFVVFENIVLFGSVRFDRMRSVHGPVAPPG